MALVNGKSGRQSRRYADAFKRSIISGAIYHFTAFKRVITDSCHVLHQLLPSLSSASQHYRLRDPTHQFHLPDRTGRLMDCNFLVRSLYKDAFD